MFLAVLLGYLGCAAAQPYQKRWRDAEIAPYLQTDAPANRPRQSNPIPVLARGRKKVIIIINETGFGSFGLFGDCPGFGPWNSAAGGGQTVAAHHRLPPLRRRLRQNLLAVAALIESAKCGRRSAELSIRNYSIP